MTIEGTVTIPLSEYEAMQRRLDALPTRINELIATNSKMLAEWNGALARERVCITRENLREQEEALDAIAPYSVQIDPSNVVGGFS